MSQSNIPSHPRETDEPSIKNERPYSIFFFPNGMVAVCNDEGQQIPKYQGRTSAAIKALKDDGYDWTLLPDINGAP